jgi:hypothetical protein
VINLLDQVLESQGLEFPELGETAAKMKIIKKVKKSKNNKTETGPVTIF